MPEGTGKRVATDKEKVLGDLTNTNSPSKKPKVENNPQGGGLENTPPHTFPEIQRSVRAEYTLGYLDYSFRKVSDAPLARGTFGSVYKAIVEDEGCSVTTALKVSNYGHPLSGDEIKGNQHVSGIPVHHPNIANIYDIRANGEYLLMEFGGSELFNLLNSGSVSYSHGARICRGVFNGVSFLHSYRLAHLDLKPENVVVDVNGIPKLVDFGNVRQVQVGVSSDSVVIGGTPTTAPPEAFIPITPDDKSFFQADVFSFAVLAVTIMGYTKVLESDSGPEDLEKYRKYFFEAYNIVWLFGARLHQGNANETRDYRDIREVLTCAFRDNENLSSVFCSCFSRHPEDRPDIDDISDAIDNLKIA